MRSNWVISFVVITTVHWRVFPSTEAASFILAQVSSCSLLLVLSSSSLNFNSYLISSANFARGLSKWRLLVGRDTSLVFSTQCNLYKIYILLDILLCSIAENFYSLFVFWLALWARQNTAQLVKILFTRCLYFDSPYGLAHVLVGPGPGFVHTPLSLPNEPASSETKPACLFGLCA